ncbi:MAG: hypothetical protein K2L67_00235 [Clostridia bacterium]|nr:hypothetical protein [Clostridia bacterium]
MKTQMRFQKILSFVTLVIAALCFVYALAFLTGGLGNVHYYKWLNSETDKINATNFTVAAQSFVSTLVIFSIVFILVVVTLFITASNKRRNYYVTNYVSIALVAVCALAIALYIIISVSNIMNLFYNDIAWEAGTNGGLNYADQFNPAYPIDKSPANFILGYILGVVVILTAVVHVLNLVWKVKLMKGEKALLQGGLVKEVA